MSTQTSTNIDNINPLLFGSPYTLRHIKKFVARGDMDKLKNFKKYMLKDVELVISSKEILELYDLVIRYDSAVLFQELLEIAPPAKLKNQPELFKIIIYGREELFELYMKIFVGTRKDISLVRLSCEYGRVKMLRTLLSKSIPLLDSSKRVWFNIAVERGYVDILTLLYENFASIFDKDFLDKCSLVSIRYGRLNVLVFLHGIGVSLRKDAIRLAHAFSREDIIKYLLRHGLFSHWINLDNHVGCLDMKHSRHLSKKQRKKYLASILDTGKMGYHDITFKFSEEE